MNDLLSEWNTERSQLQGDDTWATVPGIPAFHHPEILQLYAWGFDIPPDVVQGILALPSETLVLDLEMVLQDAGERYAAYLEKEETGDEPLPFSAISFPAHAIFLLAELKASSSLGKVCKFLGKDPKMVGYWMEEHLNEDLWLALFKLGKENLDRLQKFARNQEADWRVRAAAASAVAQVAWHYSGRRKEVFSWFESLFHHYLENFQDEDDALLLGDAISEVANLRAPDLLDTIETLFHEDLVDTSVCGSLLQVQGDMYEPVKSWAKMPIKSIQNMYQHFTDTWDIYSDAGEEDDAKLLTGGALLRGKEKSKGLAAFHPNGQPVTKEEKTGRNELCPCGSGKKYKKCHGA